ncbi:hypothetical protein F5880DRAFT_102425 [Lentinula raphanica]|nr:hypothetical protein F5880DRAFT_102425 [Lentinula raphanica]
MGEYFKLISIDNRASAGHLGKLPEFFWYWSRAVSYLKTVAVPSTYKLDTRSPEDRAKAQRMALESQSSTLLLKLPVELLLIIAGDLRKDYLHLLCFSLTCTFLWEITGQARYHSLCYKLKQESWSRNRIILIGDYAAANLPESMLTDEEKEELGLLDEHYNIFGIGSALYYVASDSFRDLAYMSNDLILGDERVQTNSTLRRELKKANRNAQCMPWISVNREDCVLKLQDGDSWMLRNLSKRVYVTLPNSERKIAQVLHCLVGHSQYSYFLHSKEGNGNWAGDRIEVTVVSVHRREHGDDINWVDITLGVKKHLQRLARDEDDYSDESWDMTEEELHPGPSY